MKHLLLSLALEPVHNPEREKLTTGNSIHTISSAWVLAARGDCWQACSSFNLCVVVAVSVLVVVVVVLSFGPFTLGPARPESNLTD